MNFIFVHMDITISFNDDISMIPDSLKEYSGYRIKTLYIKFYDQISKKITFDNYLTLDNSEKIKEFELIAKTILSSETILSITTWLEKNIIVSELYRVGLRELAIKIINKDFIKPFMSEELENEYSGHIMKKNIYTPKMEELIYNIITCHKSKVASDYFNQTNENKVNEINKVNYTNKKNYIDSDFIKTKSNNLLRIIKK